MKDLALQPFLKEIEQCVAGNRGWVSCSKYRAKFLGVPHSQLIAIAESYGLRVTLQGSLGYIASRAWIGYAG